MRLFYLINGFVRLELHPFEALGVRVKEFCNLATVEANVLDPSELELLSQVDENGADIFCVDIRTFKL